MKDSRGPAALGERELKTDMLPDKDNATARALRRARPEEIDETIRRVLAGDRACYRTVIRAFEMPLRALMASLLPAGLAIDDLVQETFISAYQRLASYPLDGTFFVWLRIMGRNLALRERRRFLRRRDLDRVFERQVEEPVGAWVADRADAIDDDTGREVRDCLTRLGETPRRVIERYYFQSATVEQIAAEEERLASWVYLIMFRAREVLARCLERKTKVSHA